VRWGCGGAGRLTEPDGIRVAIYIARWLGRIFSPSSWKSRLAEMTGSLLCLRLVNKCCLLSHLFQRPRRRRLFILYRPPPFHRRARLTLSECLVSSLGPQEQWRAAPFSPISYDFYGSLDMERVDRRDKRWLVHTGMRRSIRAALGSQV
jgi:hypothetical protein